MALNGAPSEFWQIILSCTKGIMVDTLETPHDILLRVLPESLKERCGSRQAGAAQSLSSFLLLSSTDGCLRLSAQASVPLWALLCG